MSQVSKTRAGITLLIRVVQGSPKGSLHDVHLVQTGNQVANINEGPDSTKGFVLAKELKNTGWKYTQGRKEFLINNEEGTQLQSSASGGNYDETSGLSPN